jgi:GTP-binding protein
MRVHEARFVAGASDARHLPKSHLPEIAFAGRSNVGKSSLLNKLVGRRGLARVSKTPGRTQQLNFFELDGKLVFVDLPGYGFARVPEAVKQQWKSLVEGYLESRRQLRAVVVIVDLRRGVQDEDRMLLDYLGAARIPAILVATKIDKLAHGERQQRLRDLALSPLRGVSALVGFSSMSGAGVPDLWRELDNATRSHR